MATLTFLKDDWAIAWGVAVAVGIGLFVWMVAHALGWLRRLLDHE